MDYPVLLWILIGTVIIGIVGHAAIMRVTSLQHCMSAAVVSVNLAYFVAASASALLGLKMTLASYVVGLVFVESFLVAYIFFLIGIVERSPTLSLIRLLESGGRDKGISAMEIEEFIAHADFVERRLHKLRHSSYFAEKEGFVSLSMRAKIIAIVLKAYRKALACEEEETG